MNGPGKPLALLLTLLGPGLAAFPLFCARAAEPADAKAQKDHLKQIDEAIAPVVRKMESGDFEGALRQCDRVADGNGDARVIAKLKVLRKSLPAFGLAWDEGMTRYQEGALEPAAGSLLRAYQLLEDMDLESDKLESALRTRAVRALVYKGRAAQGRQDFKAASRAFQDALRFDPSSKDAQEGMEAVREHAREIYEQAYVSRQTDRALCRKRMREVVEMLTADDELAKKAQKRLDELDGR